MYNTYTPRFNAYSNPNYYGYYGQNIPQQVNYPQQMVSPVTTQISSPQTVQQVPSVADLPIQQIRFLTADEIKGFIVMPNEKAMLVDRANKLVYIKSADAMGQSFMETYSYDKYDAEKKAEEEKVEYLRKEDLGNFLTKDDLKAFSNKLDKLEAKINLGNLLAKDKEEE